jgi:Lrp/AsnC family leucine-responsive transcriptional regulator
MPKTKLDAIDVKIVSLLQKDGKMTSQELAEQVGLSASPCARRVRNLEQSGVIKGYAALVDETEIGLSVSAFASVKLTRQHEDDLDRFAKAVSRWPEVVDCYLMTGQRDYLMRVLVRDLAEYETFLKQKLTRLDGISSIETSFALTQVKRSTYLPIA